MDVALKPGTEQWPPGWGHGEGKRTKLPPRSTAEGRPTFPKFPMCWVRFSVSGRRAATKFDSQPTRSQPKTARRSASYGRNSLLRHHQDAPLPSVWLGSSRGFDTADLNRGKGAAR